MRILHKNTVMAVMGLALLACPRPAVAVSLTDPVTSLGHLLQSSPSPAPAPVHAAAPAKTAPAPAAMPPAAMNMQPIVDNTPIRVAPNKNELIRLNEDAASVIVNNPEHATVMLDSARLLIIAPRLPGSTSFTVLNSAGQVIMQKDILVTNVQPKYVRVRRICGVQDPSCVPAAYYYCPDGCYEVTPVGGTGTPTSPAPANAANAANSAAAMGGGGAQAPAEGGSEESAPPTEPQ